MTDQTPEEDRLVDNLVSLAPEIAGGATGALIGLMGGVEGALTGSVAGPLVARFVADFAHRQLGHREKVRVSATVAFAAEKIEQRLQAGDIPRQDTFFTAALEDRSAAEETIEGILRSAQQEYEERKVRFLGNLLGNIPFHSEIDRSLANVLITTITSLSYRQLCLLSLTEQRLALGLRPQSGGELRSFLGDTDSPMGIQFILLAQDARDLYQRGLFYRKERGDTLDEHWLFGRMTPLGTLLYTLAELQEIEPSHLEDIIELLREHKRLRTQNRITTQSYTLEGLQAYEQFRADTQHINPLTLPPGQSFPDAPHTVDQEIVIMKNDDRILLVNDVVVREAHEGIELAGNTYLWLTCADETRYLVRKHEFDNLVADV